MASPAFFRSGFHLLGVVVAVLLLASGPVLAQLGTGVIEGIVLDPDGAVIPGAEVTVRNAGTGIERVLTTDASGRFRAVSLEPGLYEIKASKAGFRIAERKGVQVVVGSTTTADLTLQVGAATETVTVTESAPVIDTEKTDVTSTISEEVVANVPVIGRRFDNYVLLAPTVTADGTFGLITYRGVSGLYNNNTVDGADNNQAFFSEARGRTRVTYTWSQAAIKEFQVGLSNFNAEYGRSAGGLVNAVTKSGTNAFHGEAFYFIRDDITSAREPTIRTSTLLNAIGKEKLPERRQQFGFAMGGPVKKDKLFWFLNYDQQIRTFPYVVTTFSSAFLPAAGCATLATPNQVATCNFFQDLQTVVPRKGLNEVALGRLDWTVNPNHNLAFYYNFHQWRSVNGIRTPLINFNAASDNGFDGVRTDSLYVRWNGVLTPSVINEFRFQFGRDNEFQGPNAMGPGTSVTNGISFGMPNFLPRGQFPFEKRFQWVDNLSVIRGPHTLKFGFDINYVRESLQNLFQGGGVYSYSGLNAIALDCPEPVPMGCTPPAMGTRINYSSFIQAFDLRVLSGALPPDQAGSIFFTTTDYNFYAQDTFKIHPHVTVNYGVRYEYQKLPQPTLSNPLFPLTARINQDKNNWAPRFGLAWDIAGRHRTILRLGYGMVYGRTSNSTISSALTDNGVVFSSFTFSSTSNPANRPDYPNCFTPAVNSPCAIPFPGGTGSRPDIFQLAEDFERPFVHQAEATLEHEVVKDLVLSAAYLYSGARHLPIFRDANLPAPSGQIFFNVVNDLVTLDGRNLFPAGVYGPFPFYTGPRPDTVNVNGLLVGETVGNSTYNALVLRANKRMSRGILFDVHFTWSHAIDDGQNSQTFFSRFSTNFDPFDRGRDRSDSDFDVRRRFVTTFVWQPEGTWDMGDGAKKQVLGGWSFSGAFTAQDGRRVSPQRTGNLSGALGSTNSSSWNGSGGSLRVPFIERNAFDTPGFVNLDFRVSRSIRLAERYRVELIAESFNLFNRVNFITVNNTAYRFVSGAIAATCGGQAVPAGSRCANVDPLQASTVPLGFLDPRSASSTLNSPREFQFAIKFFW